ncbi:putative DNA helicase ino80 [Fusarium falciforme]|nr:putative DNA helicase ino80 [Fusarium falciforme]
MEKKIQNAESQIDSKAATLDPDEFDEQQYKERAQKRRRVMAELDLDQKPTSTRCLRSVSKQEAGATC